MLTRMLAVFTALAVIGFAAAVAPSPAVAQTGGDSTATTTATATPTATPAPGPESFALKPHIGYLVPHGLTRLGDKWYVSGYRTGWVYIFSDNGTYERYVNSHQENRGLATDGANILSTRISPPDLYKWTPSTTGNIVTQGVDKALPSLPGGGRFRSEGVAYDGANAWVAIAGPTSGDNKFTKHALIKITATATTIHLTNTWTSALAYENGFLYGLTKSKKPDLIRIDPANLQPYTAQNPPMNDWEVEQRNVGIRNGLAFRNGVAYGFNAAQDKVRKARQPSAERLFALTPSIGNLNPQSLARLGNKWYVGGHSGDGYIHVFNNDGTTPPSPSPSRIKKPAAEIRGLTSDGTNLIAAAVSRAEAIAFADGSRVDVRVPHVYKWTPQTNSTTSVSATPFCIPNALGYTPNGVAHDGTHIWVALDSPARNILVKLNGTTGAHIGTYRMNAPVAGLTYQNGNLYGLSGGNIVIAIASHLKTSPATWVNNWEVVKRDSGLANGLVFRNGTAYGFNAAQDEVRAERGNPTIAPTAPTTPTTTTPTTPTTTTPTTSTSPTSPAS